MDLKKATTLASVTVMTFMLAGGFFVKVNSLFLDFLCFLISFVSEFFCFVSFRKYRCSSPGYVTYPSITTPTSFFLKCSIKTLLNLSTG